MKFRGTLGNPAAQVEGREISEGTFRDTGENADLVPRHENVLGWIKQEVNAAYRVDRSGGPDSEIAAGQWRRAFPCQLGDQLTT
jgi:hypothetical protein